MNIKEIILAEQVKRPPGRPFDLPPIEGGGGGGGFGGSSVAPRGGLVQAVPGSSSGLVMPTGKLGTVPRTTAPTTATTPKAPAPAPAPASAPATATTPKAPAPATATTPSTASVVGKKIGQWAKDAAVGTAKSLARTAAVGTGLYYAAPYVAPYAWDYATKPPEAYGEKGFQQEKARQAEIERERKAMNATDTSTTMQPTVDTPTQPTVDTTSPEQQTSDDDGPLSVPGTFKTNEDSKELDRVKHLARYRN